LACRLERQRPVEEEREREGYEEEEGSKGELLKLSPERRYGFRHGFRRSDGRKRRSGDARRKCYGNCGRKVERERAKAVRQDTSAKARLSFAKNSELTSVLTSASVSTKHSTRRETRALKLYREVGRAKRSCQKLMKTKAGCRLAVSIDCSVSSDSREETKIFVRRVSSVAIVSYKRVHSSDFTQAIQSDSIQAICLLPLRLFLSLPIGNLSLQHSFYHTETSETDVQRLSQIFQSSPKVNLIPFL